MTIIVTGGACVGTGAFFANRTFVCHKSPVYGGFNDRIVFRTYLGDLDAAETDDAFSPIRSYRFDAYDTDTGVTETLLEADLPYVSYYYGYSIMSMTWEGDRYVIHTYNLSTGKETVRDLDVTPEFLTDEPNRTIKWINLGEALDNTHFTLGYCELDDVFSNTLGGLIGIMIYYILSYLKRRLRRKRYNTICPDLAASLSS